MIMTTLKFKTSLNCNNCVAKVSAMLDKLVGADKWSVDVINPDKILSVEVESLAPEEVVEALKGFGYRAEKLD